MRQNYFSNSQKALSSILIGSLPTKLIILHTFNTKLFSNELILKPSLLITYS